MDVHGRDLRYFVAVAEELHFTRAAERLYVSQPALSKQISALERSLGVELFARVGREIRLTAAGTALLDPARQVLAAWETAESAVLAAKRAQAATLNVGFSTSPGRSGIAAAVRSRFSEAAPEAALHMHQVGWDDATAGLADQSNDIAYVWLPLPEAERYRWQVIAEEPRHVALPEGHRLAGHTEVPFHELLFEPFLALPRSAGPLRDYWLALDERDGLPARVGAQIAGIDETYEALVDGRGVCLLAAGNAPALTRGGVVTRPVPDIAGCRLALAWRADDRNPLIAVYVDAARRVIDR
ncbi:MAG: LysR family transcriptional regulator [Solirubrobacterales bacterium]|nr:LysR family transcriptional regulator [Solirubrobacterales bacterium]